MFYDFTSFKNGDWNGWETPLTQDELALLANESEYCLAYPRPSPTTTSRLLLSRVFSGLEVGKNYQFGVRLRRSAALGGGMQIMHVTVDDNAAAEKWHVKGDMWQQFVTRFQAKKNSHQISLWFNHELPGHMLGGNFRLDNLRLVRMGETEKELFCTRFVDGWDGWEPGPSGRELKLIARRDKQYCVGFDSPHAVMGVLLKKAFPLDKEQRYEFRVDACEAGFDVATVSMLNLNTVASSMQHAITTTLWTTHVWPFVANGQSEIQIIGRDAPYLQAAGVLIDDLNIHESMNETTDFSGEDDEQRLNGWALGTAANNGARFGKESGELGDVLIFTTPSGNNEGEILFKEFADLAPGVRFTFVMRVWSTYPTNLARLTVQAGDQIVIPETIIENRSWKDFSGVFVADDKPMKLSISNSVKTGNGNDFRFSEIRVSTAT